MLIREKANKLRHVNRHRFAVITAVLTVLALIIGNLVVATGSGDACGTDWPTCKGNLLPDFLDYKQVIEYSHRLFTGSLGFVILINAVLAWKRKYTGETSIGVLTLLTMALLLIQSMVGAFNVILGTPPGFTTLDVVVSLFLLTSTVFLAVALQRVEVKSHEGREINHSYKKLFSPALWVFTIYFLEVTVGAFLKHSGASKIVNSMVTDELLISSNLLSKVIYNIHGISNTLIVIGALYLLFMSIRKSVLVPASAMFFLLIVVNGVTGFMTQLSSLNQVASSIHMIVVVITVFQGAYLVSKAYFGPCFFTWTVKGEEDVS
ncbi:heme A synthase [Lentibacillus cibarius]|uniref:Heme A synthase n=1 Tax=Lentibacillus cibarius TaxID=2583219 RepID=A0A5S3QMV1_9BACI|nr:heme A synthase [Lentibacillus cibarius]